MVITIGLLNRKRERWMDYYKEKQRNKEKEYMHIQRENIEITTIR